MLAQMLQTGSKAWSLGLDEVMKQINNSPHESLPTGVTPNHVMFGRKQRLEAREPPAKRGIVMAISEEMINRVCSTDHPDINEKDVGAVEIALESNIQEVLLNGAEENEAEDKPEHYISADHSSTNLPTRSPTRIFSSSPAVSPSRTYTSSPKGKGKAVEMTLSEEETENDPEAAAAEEEGEKDQDQSEAEIEEGEADEGDDDEDDDEEDKEEKLPLNAREPANETVRALDAQVLKHQSHQREKMQQKYNASHKVVVFKEGDFASMAIPKENRAPTDNLRMIVKILEIPRYNRHRVQSIHGVIKGLISTSSLNVVIEQLVPDFTKQFQNAPTKVILLSQAAAMESNTDHVSLACNCKKKCTKRCICVKNSRLCSQFCHKSEINCGNLPDAIAELTEAQLVSRTDYTGPLKAPKRKRSATSSTKKPAAKRATSSRNQPSSAIPLTTRAKAKTGEHSNINFTLINQTTMSQFAPFAALAHRHSSAIEQLASKGYGEMDTHNG